MSVRNCDISGQCWLPILKKCFNVTLIKIGPISFSNINATLYYDIFRTSDTNVPSILVSDVGPIFFSYLIPEFFAWYFKNAIFATNVGTMLYSNNYNLQIKTTHIYNLYLIYFIRFINQCGKVFLLFYCLWRWFWD